jgi:hypothetical protein
MNNLYKFKNNLYEKRKKFEIITFDINIISIIKISLIFYTRSHKIFFYFLHSFKKQRFHFEIK